MGIGRPGQERERRIPLRCYGAEKLETSFIELAGFAPFAPFVVNPLLFPAYRSFFTRIFEFRPLDSYRSRRAGGRSSGVPSLKPALF